MKKEYNVLKSVARYAGLATLGAIMLLETGCATHGLPKYKVETYKRLKLPYSTPEEREYSAKKLKEMQEESIRLHANLPPTIKIGNGRNEPQVIIIKQEKDITDQLRDMREDLEFLHRQRAINRRRAMNRKK